MLKLAYGNLVVKSEVDGYRGFLQNKQTKKKRVPWKKTSGGAIR